jgi:SDR family mycofactocin-dependent oxidoreductase
MGGRIVVALAARGWQVVALDRGDDDDRLPYRVGASGALEAVVAEGCRVAGGAAADDPEAPVVGHLGDAARHEVLATAVAEAEGRFGGLDAVVAAAGVIAGGVASWEVPVEQEEAVLEVDLRAVLVAARAGVPALLRRGEPRRGRFVAVASAAAVRGLPLLAAYCAAKAGVVGFVRALAVELAGTGVTANAVSPGSTATPLLEESARLYGLASAEAFAAQQPIGRLVRPEEVAAGVCYLLSAEAGAITGANLAVDGGLSL